MGPGVSGRIRVGASLRCLGGEIFDLAVVELFVDPYELLFAENRFVAGAKEERLEVGLCGKLASRGSEWTSARAVSRSCKRKELLNKNSKNCLSVPTCEPQKPLLASLLLLLRSPASISTSPTFENSSTKLWSLPFLPRVRLSCSAVASLSSVPPSFPFLPNVW